MMNLLRHPTTITGLAMIIGSVVALAALNVLGGAGLVQAVLTHFGVKIQ